MNYKHVSTTLRRIANKVLTQDDLAKRIIIRRGNTYHAYDKYTIMETPDGWQVTTDTLAPLLFNTAKVALAWCILDKAGRYAIIKHMEWLDSRITAKQSDIDVTTFALDHAEKIDNRAILLARLTEDINCRQMYKKQLGKCAETAKYIKLKGTNNELNRPYKTSRRKRRN